MLTADLKVGSTQLQGLHSALHKRIENLPLGDESGGSSASG